MIHTMVMMVSRVVMVSVDTIVTIMRVVMVVCVVLIDLMILVVWGGVSVWDDSMNRGGSDGGNVTRGGVVPYL